MNITKTKLFKTFFISSFFLFGFAGITNACDYFISPTGNNGNSGITIDKPWKTITHANSRLTAGDTVCLRVGTYSGQQIKPRNSGTSVNYITYTSYPGEKAIVGEPVITNSTLFYVAYFLENVNYIKIDNIRFANIGSYFGELKNAEYCVIQNNEFYNSQSYGGTKVGWLNNYSISAPLATNKE